MKRRTLAILASGVVTAILVGCLLISVVGWDRVYALHRDIDISSGDVRESRVLLGFTLSKNVKETRFSRYSRMYGTPAAPVWVRDSTSAPGTFIMYENCGFISMTDKAVDICNSLELDDGQRRCAILKILSALRTCDLNRMDGILQELLSTNRHAANPGESPR